MPKVSLNGAAGCTLGPKAGCDFREPGSNRCSSRFYCEKRTCQAPNWCPNRASFRCATRVTCPQLDQEMLRKGRYRCLLKIRRSENG